MSDVSNFNQARLGGAGGKRTYGHYLMPDRHNSGHFRATDSMISDATTSNMLPFEKGRRDSTVNDATSVQDSVSPNPTDDIFDRFYDIENGSVVQSQAQADKTKQKSEEKDNDKDKDKHIEELEEKDEQQDEKTKDHKRDGEIEIEGQKTPDTEEMIVQSKNNDEEDSKTSKNNEKSVGNVDDVNASVDVNTVVVNHDNETNKTNNEGIVKTKQNN